MTTPSPSFLFSHCGSMCLSSSLLSRLSTYLPAGLSFFFWPNYGYSLFPRANSAEFGVWPPFCSTVPSGPGSADSYEHRVFFLFFLPRPFFFGLSFLDGGLGHFFSLSVHFLFCLSKYCSMAIFFLSTPWFGSPFACFTF